MTNNFNGISHVKKGLNTGEVVGFVMGVLLFSVSIYAFSLSIKANRMSIEKMTNENNSKKV